MRPAPAVFLLVCLGLGLLGGIQHFADIPQSDGPAPLLLTERREVMVARPRSVVTTPAQAPSKSQPSISWRSLESRDFKQLIRNLRAVECPEPTIRDIVFQRVNLHFAEREGLVRFKLAGPAKDWASRPPLTDEEIERAKQWRAFQLEKRALLKDLLNVDLPLDVLPSKYARNYEDCQAAVEALPEAKRDAVRKIKEQYWQDSDALKEKHAKGPRSEYVEEYRRLNEEHQKELASVLSPRELDEFLIRTSVTGTRLAARLPDFGPSEDEFRAIFNIVRQREEETGRVGAQYGLRQVDQETKVAADEKMAEQLRSVLGEDRYAEFERCQDKGYLDLAWVARRHGLPQELAVRAYELEKAYEVNWRQIEGGLRAAGASAAELDASSRQMREEVRSAQEKMLGEEAFKTYRSLSAGGLKSWSR